MYVTNNEMFQILSISLEFKYFTNCVLFVTRFTLIQRTFLLAEDSKSSKKYLFSKNNTKLCPNTLMQISIELKDNETDYELY